MIKRYFRGKFDPTEIAECIPDYNNHPMIKRIYIRGKWHNFSSNITVFQLLDHEYWDEITDEAELFLIKL